VLSPSPRAHFLILAGVALAAGAAAACGPSGSPPSLQAVEDQVVAVNQELVLVLAATDEDGDQLDYSFSAEVPDIGEHATIAALPVGAGEFRWIPLAADVGVWDFTFTVSDGSHEDTASARIDVRSAVGDISAPSFLHPQGMGTTLDLEKASCLDLDLEIVDSDSTEVELGQIEPLVAGAEVDQTGGLRGAWRWCPSPAQIEADDRYSAVLSADDHDNPLTVHPYLIVLRRPIKPDCPGEAPVVDHEPADLTTAGAVALSAQISDDQGLKREPLLYYSTTAPSDPPDLSQMTQVAMTLDAGDMLDGTWRATVPNPVAGQDTGASARIYYLIAAGDDDDPVGSCDHLTQAPAAGVFFVNVTNPGGEGGGELCEPCSQDAQCGGVDDLCVRVGGGSDASCLQACAGPADCPADFTCSSAPVVSVNGTSARQCVPQSSDCASPGGETCEDDELEDNDNQVQASFAPLLPIGARDDLVSCPAEVGTGDDEDWYDLELDGDTRVTLALSGGDDSDLDLGIYQQDGALIDASQSLDSEETVTACLPAGVYTARVFAFGPARNPYSLSLAEVAETCPQICDADENEDDDGPGEARPTDLTPGPFVSTDQSICADDDDWYEVSLSTGDLLVADLTFTQASSREDLDLHLHDQDGVDLTPCTPEEPAACDLANGQSADSDEHFEMTAPSGCAPCTFYLVVRGFDGAENDYDISIESR